MANIGALKSKFQFAIGSSSDILEEDFHVGI